MAVKETEGGLTLIFDECLSERMAKTLSDCGAKLTPKLEVKTLAHLNMLSTYDPDWVKKCADNGWSAVSSDCKMVSDHDIARLAEEFGVVVFLLKSDISQQNRWGLLRWHLNHLPKLCAAISKFKGGGSWYVDINGGLRPVVASRRSEKG